MNNHFFTALQEMENKNDQIQIFVKLPKKTVTTFIDDDMTFMDLKHKLYTEEDTFVDPAYYWGTYNGKNISDDQKLVERGVDNEATIIIHMRSSRTDGQGNLVPMQPVKIRD